MSCVSCECFAKRISNIFRDEDLKLKYLELTGSKILCDSFICDGCNDKLESAHSFRKQCLEVYNKLYPNKAAEPTIQILKVKTNQETQTEEFEEDVVDDGGFEIEMINYEEAEAIYGKKTEDKDPEFIEPVDQNELTSENDESEEFLYLEYEDTKPKPEKTVCKRPTRNSQKPVVNRKSYTVQEKLKIIEYAEAHNNRSAARTYNINESSVRCFRRQKEMLLKMNPEKKTNRKAYPHWPGLEKELKEFVVNYPTSHGTKAKLKDIRMAAIDIASKHGIENFNGSSSYIFKFMIRNQLPSASPRPRKIKVEAKT